MATIFPIDLNWNWLCTGIRSSLYVLLSRCCHMVIMIYVGNLGQKGGNWVKYWCPSLPLSSWFSGANWINLRACILNVLSLLSFKPIFFFQDWQVFSQAVSHVLHTIQSHLLDYPCIFLSCFELPLSLEGLKLMLSFKMQSLQAPQSREAYFWVTITKKDLMALFRKNSEQSFSDFDILPVLIVPNNNNNAVKNNLSEDDLSNICKTHLRLIHDRESENHFAFWNAALV